MIDYKIKGLLNQHLKINYDFNNITNNDNMRTYSQALEGNYQSIALDYLLNLGFVHLNDVKSINKYNSMNLTAKINEGKAEEEIIDENTIILNKVKRKVKKNIIEILEQRHSSRIFEDIKMNFDDFSFILQYAFGLAKRKANYNGIIVNTRHYASGGGIYPLEIYIVVNNVGYLDKGIYKYQPYSHSIFKVDSKIQIEKLLEYGSFDFKNYSFCVLYQYDVNKNYLKYGELSLFITFVEIGIISHNFELVCTTLDYSACQIAGFDKHYAEDCLGLDGVNSHILYSVLCGKE